MFFRQHCGNTYLTTKHTSLTFNAKIHDCSCPLFFAPPSIVELKVTPLFEPNVARVSSIKKDVLSGLTVSFALVPEGLAFGFVAGVEPLVSMYAAFFVCLITSLIGGRPGMISGAAGALAVVMVGLVAEHGVQYLFAAVVLMGILQILAGIFKLGKFIRMVPHPVMLGFVNGLAIVIFLAQLAQLGVSGTPGWLSGTFVEGSGIDIAWLQGSEMNTMLSLIALTMLIIHFLPKLTNAVPSSLAAIVIVTAVVLLFGIDTRTVGDLAHISGGLPEFNIPAVPMTLETLWIILPYSVVLAIIGLIESLLTLRMIDDMTDTHGSSNKESVGQGIANVVTGFFGGMGGCAMVGQSMINMNSGGRGRLSGITAALAILAFILFAAPLIEMIPMAVLVGVMFIVVLGTFEWSSFRIIRQIPGGDAFVLVLVSVVTVLTDLAVAVISGVIVSALIFAWEKARSIGIKRQESENSSTTYKVRGPLFFGSTTEFLGQFTPKQDSRDVIIDFADSRVCDHSGLDAIDTLAERYLNVGKQLHLIHLSKDCQTLLKKAGDLVEVNIIEDPKYFVATNA